MSDMTTSKELLARVEANPDLILERYEIELKLFAESLRMCMLKGDINGTATNAAAIKHLAEHCAAYVRNRARAVEALGEKPANVNLRAGDVPRGLREPGR